jgi:flagellar assembly factor FliW
MYATASFETGMESKPIPAPSAPAPAKGEEVIESRFGKIKINRANAVFFPRGIIGFPENLDFCLADFPNPKMEQFKVLQCLNDKELSFVVLPLERTNHLVETADIDEACQLLGIETTHLAMLLIVSVHRKSDGINLSVNARAPIFVDAEQKLAAQFVLPNSKYQIRHFIS